MPRKVIRNAVAWGEDDPLVFVLAEKLGKHLHEMDMPQRDYVRWVAFYEWRAANEDVQRRMAEMRANRK